MRERAWEGVRLGSWKAKVKAKRKTIRDSDVEYRCDKGVFRGQMSQCKLIANFENPGKD